MRETFHVSHDAQGNNFREVTTGDAPSSAEIAINAKGVAQLTVKAYYPDAKTMAAEAQIDLEEAILNLANMLYRHGIQVAGVHSALSTDVPELPGSEGDGR